MKLFDFKYTRQSIGIFLVFMGSPLIFFFKETLGFGGSSAFTVAGFCSGFVFMVSIGYARTHDVPERERERRR